MTSSGRSTPSNLQNTLPPPFLPPPSLTQLPITNPPQSQPQKQSTSLFDDDDFSAFLSPPAKAGPTQPSLVQAVSSNKPKAHSTPLIGAPPRFPNMPSEHHSSHHRKNSSKNSNHNLLDDEFDEFVSSPTLRTPTPPRPPSKMSGHINPPPPPQGLRSTKNRDSLPPPPPPPPQKTSRAAAHARTLSLVETAAARPGRWPAPPSPLPEAIAPPPPPPSTSSKGPPLNVFDNGEGEEVVQLSQPLTRGKPQTQTLASDTLWNASPVAGSSSGTTLPLRAMSPPLVLNKANGAAMAAPTASSNPSLWSLGANSGGKSLTPSAGSRNKPTSGLSAQDLSFFEGL